MQTILIFYLCYIFIAKLVTGATLSGSSPYSVLDQTFQFTCTQTGSITSASLIFKRSSTTTICTIANPGDASQCAQFRAARGYSCYCGGSGVFYMNISSVSLQDEDRWFCTVNSQKSNSITLPVYYGPYNNVTFNKKSPVTVIEDVVVSLTTRCSAHCKPDCSYTWWRGSQQVSDNRDLSLGSFRRGQEVDYTCRAENTVTGDTADSQVLTVNVHWYPAQPTHNCPPWIVLGQTGSCTCQTSDRGNPAGTVQWRNPDNQQISSSSTSSSVQLNLASIPRSDNGRSYICRAVNSLSNSNKDTTYTVNVAFGPPGVSITGNQQIDAPDVLTLTCTTTGPVNPAPTLTWRNSTDGAVLSGTSPVRLGSSQDGGYVYRSTLSITTQWYQDGDTIVCEGRNPGIQSQQTVTDSEQLDINHPPQSAPVISGLSRSPIYEGDSVSVTCRVIGGKPLVTSITLTCPGGHQSSSTTTEGSDTRITTLTFSVTRDLRSQPCRCSAVHSTGRYQLSANKTKNNIYYPPSEPSMSVSPPLPWLQGQSASAVCQSVDTGYPPASYLWYKDDVLVHQSGQLDLVNVTFQDNSKTFSCMSSNKFTEVKGVTLQSKQIILDVHFSPVLMIHPNSPVRIPAGSDLVLNCSTVSNPVNPAVSWYLGDKLLSMNGVLRLLSASTRDSGTYTCKATVMSDKFGNLSSVLITVLNVYDRPIEPKHFYCIVETEARITLHWEDRNLLKENVSFLLEQRSDDNKEYSLVDAVIQKSLSSPVYTASVARQKGSTLYYFRILTLDLGQQSDTVITTCFTSAGENGSNFAAGVGTGIGSTVGVVLLVLVIVYLCRRHTLKSNETGRTDKSHIYQNASFGTGSHEESVTIDGVQQKNEYAELEAREPQQPNTYEKITAYENAENM